jgi:hypothetical protein
MLEMPELKPAIPGHRLAFFGPMVSGKTFCANAMVDSGEYVKVAFADKLKYIAKELYGVMGKDGSDRTLLQALGADLRKHDPEVWIKYLLRKVEAIEKDKTFAYTQRVVLDDLRYTNEADVLRRNGFLLILVTVPEEERQRRIARLYPSMDPTSYYHESERQWEAISYDGVVRSSSEDEPVVKQIGKIILGATLVSANRSRVSV